MPGETARENGKLGGRPKGSVATRTMQTQKMRDRLTARMYEKADAIFDAWEDLALGHYVTVRDPLTGERRVYKKSPNGLALKDMMEQVWGKPKQPIEVGVIDEPEFDYEALQRLGKYVEPTDTEFIELAAAAPSAPAFGAAIARKSSATIYHLRGVDRGPAPRPEDHAKGVDTLNAQK